MVRATQCLFVLLDYAGLIHMHTSTARLCYASQPNATEPSLNLTAIKSLPSTHVKIPNFGNWAGFVATRYVIYPR